MSFINALMVLIYFLCTAFVITSSIILQTLDMRDQTSCTTAIYCCLVFYFFSKGVLQLFLIERAHMIRAHQCSRLKDPIWTVFVSMLIMGFGSLTIVAFLRPVAQVSNDMCRIGIPPYVALPLLLYEVTINLCLTGIFVCLLNSLVKPHEIDSRGSGVSIETLVSVKSEPNLDSLLQREIKSSVVAERRKHHEGASKATNLPSSKNRGWTERLIARSTIGLIFVLIPTVANLILMYYVHGQEKGWECLTFCCIDGESCLRKSYKRLTCN